MLIIVKSSFAKFAIKIPEEIKNPSVDYVIRKIVHTCAVQMGQIILPCTFTIQKAQQSIKISADNIDTIKFDALETPIAIIIGSSTNQDYTITHSNVPDSDCPELRELLNEPLPNIERILSLLEGVTRLRTDNFYESLTDAQMNTLSIIIPYTTITRLVISHHKMTKIGTEILDQMLKKEHNLEDFVLHESKCLPKDEVNKLIATAKQDQRFQTFNIDNMYEHEVAAIKKSNFARSVKCNDYFKTHFFADLLQILFMMPLPLVQMIYSYLSPQDLKTEDVNSALLYLLMPGFPWQKLNAPDSYGMTCPSKAHAQSIGDRLMLAINNFRDKHRHNHGILGEACALPKDDYTVKIMKTTGGAELQLTAATKLLTALNICDDGDEQLKHFKYFQKPSSRFNLYFVCTESDTDQTMQRALNKMHDTLWTASLAGNYSIEILKKAVQIAKQSVPLSKIYDTVTEFYREMRDHKEIPTFNQFQGYTNEAGTSLPQLR